ncbi:hypothetical protein HYS31_01325 [Candidatus Woesearchaeota archaeon]|nr:hypothetical protein [Candidatus Woesearchaeota archaeon]
MANIFQSFENEDALYDTVISSLEQIVNVLRVRDPEFAAKIGNSKIQYMLRQFKDQRLYVVGEMHNTKAPVEYIHNKIVPKIRHKPQSWLILSEGHRKFQPSLKSSPGEFYMAELAKMFNTPIEDALAELEAEETRAYICQNSQLCDDDVLSYLVNGALFVHPMYKILAENPQQNIRDVKELLKFMDIVLNEWSKRTGKSRGHLESLIMPSPLLDDWIRYENHRTLITDILNKYSKHRLYEILRQYESKTNVLVNAGWNHFPAFEIGTLIS